MRIREVLGGIYVIITEEENELLSKYFSVDNKYVNESQLTDRESVIADRLTHKGVLMPTLRGYRTV